MLLMITPLVDAETSEQLPDGQVLAAASGKTVRRSLWRSLAVWERSTQALLLLMLLAYVAQLVHPRLTVAGARIASRLDHGEWHRLATPLLLHADLVHLARTCLFGISRLMPPAAAVYGGQQSLLIFSVAGIMGNVASYRLNPSLNIPAVGASAAILGLDGAITGHALRATLGSQTPAHAQAAAIRAALHRASITLIAMCVQPLVLTGGKGFVDHTAHAAGYLTGLVLGFLLAPCGAVAMASFESRVYAECSSRVCETCGESSMMAERAIAAYLRRVPSSQRAAVARNWRLPPSPTVTGRSVASTEDWSDVFRRLKEVVGEDMGDKRKVAEAANEAAAARAAMRAAARSAARAAAEAEVKAEAEVEVATASKEATMTAAESAAAAAAVDGPARSDETGAGESEGREDDELSYLRTRAEGKVWAHFADRAAVATPSFRLLHEARMGRITMTHLRRWRVAPLGALIPPWIAESLVGLVGVYMAWACLEALHLATSRSRVIAY